MNVLIAGCSFVGLLNGRHGLSSTNKDYKFDIYGMSAAGNQAIAAQVLHKLAQQKYDKVVVLWSGINRIDVPLGSTVHNSMIYLGAHPCYSKIGDHYWYHSGGFGCGGTYPPTPKFIIEYFHAQYREPKQDYLTDISLQNVLLVNSFLKTQNIPFYSSFIYDITADYKNDVDKSFGHSLDYTLGQANSNSKFLSMLSDTLVLKNTPYECAKDSNQLGSDEFHPTQDFMINWVNSNCLRNSF